MEGASDATRVRTAEGAMENSAESGYPEGKGGTDQHAARDEKAD